MNKKNYWEKLLEEFPEHEKEIKDTSGYQMEMLRKTIEDLIAEISKEFMPVFEKFKRRLFFVRIIFFIIDIKSALKRFFKHIFKKFKKQ